MEESEMVFSFGIDHGELDGYTPQEIFVMGFQLGEINKLDPSSGHVLLYQTDNQDRVERMLKYKGFTYEKNVLNDDWIQWLIKGK